MSTLHIEILAPFLVLHCFWLVSGLGWVVAEFSGAQPPKSLGELKSRANQFPRWYLIPFHDRTLKIWKYCSWVTGFAWLAAAFIERRG